MEHISTTGLGIRSALAAFCTWLSVRFGTLVPVMGLLVAAMLLDFVTGWAAALIGGVPISSQVGGRGIVKKVLYIVGVIVGLFADFLIPAVAGAVGLECAFRPVFGLLVAFWLILNELVSILENLDRAGVHMPAFLLAVIKRLKIGVEAKGNTIAEEEGES